MASEKTIGRLSLYRRLLRVMRNRGVERVFSHELAAAARVTAAQVRRDLMGLGYTGSPVRGYEVAKLKESIAATLEGPVPEGVALVGIGRLGRAIMSYFRGRRPKLAIVVAFDADPAKVNRVIHGCRCCPVEEMEQVIRESNIRLAVIAVPASQAQAVADRLVGSGVRGILNLAPMPLQLPPGVYVEALDMTGALEKVAYFARQAQAGGGTPGAAGGPEAPT